MLHVIHPSLRQRSFSLAAILVVLGASITAEARVTKIEITRVESPTFAGTTFGDVGQYEKLVGRVYGEVDPRDRLNAMIQDISRAPKNERGMVEYVTDLYILKPLDLRRGNGTLYFDFMNRGNKNILGRFNIGVVGGNEPTNAGDGFLQKLGHTIVWSGWQGDILRTAGRMSIDVPVARNRDGSEITGELRVELSIQSNPRPSMPLSESVYTAGTSVYESVSTDNRTATLTRRVREKDRRMPVSRADWAFADCSSVPFPGAPSASHICLRDGFDTNHLYELIYTAKNPTVLGLGFAATRDVMAFLQHDAADDSGTPNPLAGGIRRSLMYGVSQSGAAIRMFLHLGFNEDESRRIVFDGAHVDQSAGLQTINARFAQAGRSPFQYTDHDFSRYEAPLSWGPDSDALRRRIGWILERCTRSDTCPKIVQTNTSGDYWNHRVSASTTNPVFRYDLHTPKNVRVYFSASVAHAPGTGTIPICKYPLNPNTATYQLRALTVALQDWVASHKQPPRSDNPALQERALVRPDRLKWLAIPGVTYTGLVASFPLLDFGPRFDHDDQSGIITKNPPRQRGEYPIFVPQVDEDGNDVEGIRSDAMLAPIGTYTGFNYRSPGFAEDEICDNRGMFFPFSKTRADRNASGDPRKSLEERYGNHAGYVAAVRAAALRLVARGLLLAEDANSLVARAEASDVLR